MNSNPSPRQVAWTFTFLGVTAVAVGMEIFAAAKRHEHFPAWTTLTVRHLPKPVALAAAGYLSTWLPWHLMKHYKKHGK